MFYYIGYYEYFTSINMVLINGIEYPVTYKVILGITVHFVYFDGEFDKCNDLQIDFISNSEFNINCINEKNCCYYKLYCFSKI